MITDDRLQDLLDAVALGISSEEEAALIEDLAADDESIARGLAANRALVERLAGDVPHVTPPARLRQAALGEVRAATDPPARRGWARSLRRPVGIAIAGVVAGLVLAFGAYGLSDRGPSPAPSTLAVAGTVAAPEVRGQITFLDGGSAAALRLTDLPALREGQGYQVWRLRGDRAESAGFLAVSGEGRAAGVASGLAGVDAIAVTVERAGNPGGPTSAPVLRAPLPAPAV